ncbi:MAG: hypothetical protein OEV37_00880 [Candidatus Berkelbacteria bacterium]|nr:hypothetical protein [Candidatus Berkelbacteria bacterium]
MKDEIVGKWRNWHYKNTLFLALGLLSFFLLLRSPAVVSLLKSAGNFGYLGSFISGVFFVSIFTVAPATAVLFELAENFNPVLVALFAGLGAVLGDYFIFRFLKDRVFQELSELFRGVKRGFIGGVFRTPYFSWLIPLLGALIIALPLPDEMGVAVMGLSKVKTWQFVAITFLLNSIGILLVVTLARSF